MAIIVSGSAVQVSQDGTSPSLIVNQGPDTAYLDVSPSVTPGSAAVLLYPNQPLTWQGGSLWAITKPGESARLTQLYNATGTTLPFAEVTGSVDARVTDPIQIDGPVTVNGAVGIDGPVTVQGDVGIDGPVTVQGDVGIDGPVTVNGAVGIDGPVGISGPVTVSGAVGISGPVLVGGGALEVSNTVSVTGALVTNGQSYTHLIASGPLLYGKNEFTGIPVSPFANSLILYITPPQPGEFVSSRLTITDIKTSQISPGDTNLYSENPGGQEFIWEKPLHRPASGLIDLVIEDVQTFGGPSSFRLYETSQFLQESVTWPQIITFSTTGYTNQTLTLAIPPSAVEISIFSGTSSGNTGAIFRVSESGALSYYPFEGTRELPAGGNKVVRWEMPASRYPRNLQLERAGGLKLPNGRITMIPKRGTL